MILEESVLKERKRKRSKIIYPTTALSIPSTVMTVAEDRSANMNIEACEAIRRLPAERRGRSSPLKAICTPC